MVFQRSLGLLFLFLCMAVFLGGCSREPEDAQGTVRLRFSVLGAKQESDLAQAWVDAFEKKHPEIKIEVEPVAGMGYEIKLIMQSAADTLPDLLFLCDSLVPTFTEYKIVRDLTEFIENDPTFSVDDIYPQMLATGMDKEGHLFQLPRELGVVLMFYNSTLFQKAGLPDPSPDWTREDFLRMAEQLTLRDDKGRVTQYGFAGNFRWCGIYAPWIVSEGGRLVTPDGKTSTLSSPESLKGISDLIGLVTEHDVALPPDRSLTIPGVDPFAAGKIAIQPQVFPQVPLYRATMKDFEWDVQVMPKGSVCRATNMGAAGYGISRNSKYPNEAWEFLKFIVSQEGQRILGEAGSGIPVLKSLAKDPCWRKPGKSPQNYDAFIQSVEFGIGWEDFLIFTKPEIQDIVSQAFEKSLLRQASVEEAFTEADAKINKILEEKKQP